MSKKFCLAIALVITVLFVFGCNQSENTEMERHVSEKLETKSESASGIDEHANPAPMVASSDDAKNDPVLGRALCTPQSKMSESGSCPVCKMDLIPIYEGSGLELTEQQKALIPVRTEPIAFRGSFA